MWRSERGGTTLRRGPGTIELQHPLGMSQEGSTLMPYLPSALSLLHFHGMGGWMRKGSVKVDPGEQLSS